MAITLRQLTYLCALADRRHFGKAAEQCAVSQPALSVQIRELESGLGVDLIDRSGRSPALTSAGREVVERSRRILAGVDDLVLTAQRSRGMEGAFALGIIPTVAPYILPTALELIRTRLPKLELKVREATTDNLIEELRAGALDACILATNEAAPDLAQETLFRDRFLLAVHEDEAAFRGLQDGRVAMGDVAEMKLLLLDEGHCLREQALAICKLSTRDASAQLGASSMTTLLRLVAGGYGATLAPEIAFDEAIFSPPMRVIHLASPEPERVVNLTWRGLDDGGEPFAALAAVLAEAGERRQAEARRSARWRDPAEPGSL